MLKDRVKDQTTAPGKFTVYDNVLRISSKADVDLSIATNRVPKVPKVIVDLEVQSLVV